MYASILRNADQIRRFTVTDSGDSGWEVREESDSRVVRIVRYTDWHRVERALMTFATVTASLKMAGWVETN